MSAMICPSIHWPLKESSKFPEFSFCFFELAWAPDVPVAVVMVAVVSVAVVLEDCVVRGFSVLGIGISVIYVNNSFKKKLFASYFPTLPKKSSVS